MSYILDALQRADAERERGRVPGLKSQLMPPAGRDRQTPTALRPWHALAAVVVVLLALGTWWWASDEATSPADSTPVASPPNTPTPDTPATAAPAAPELPASNSPPERVATPAEPVQPILAPPRPAPAASDTAATNAATPPAAATKGATPVSTPAAAAPKAPAGTAVPTFGELTAEARAQLPAVNVSGSTYSQNPALRMLIANGKVVQEGQDIAPGLRLETIGPRSAVLNHQGLRYSIGY